MSEKKQVYVAVDKKDKLFYYDGEKYTPVLDETGGGGDIELKTINGQNIKGSGNIAITTYQAFPSAWPTDNKHTTKQFCDAIDADASAVIGMGYFGGARWSDKPAGLANGDVVVEILEGPNHTKAIHLIMTSSTVAPYRWEYTYWSHGSESGWRGVQPELVSGTNIKTINNQSLLGAGNIEIEGGDATFKQDVYQPMFEPEGFPCFIFAAPIQDETMFLEVMEGGDTDAWMRVLDYVRENDEHNITDNFGLVWNITSIQEEYEFEGEARVDVTTNSGLQRMFCHFHLDADEETGDAVVVIDEHSCDGYIMESGDSVLEINLENYFNLQNLGAAFTVFNQPIENFLSIQSSRLTSLLPSLDVDEIKLTAPNLVQEGAFFVHRTLKGTFGMEDTYVWTAESCFESSGNMYLQKLMFFWKNSPIQPEEPKYPLFEIDVIVQEIAAANSNY